MVSTIFSGLSQQNSPISNRVSSPGGPTPPSPTNPNGPSPWGSDSVSLSQEAAVDPGRCGNDWRCLDQLQRRGLLA